MRKAALLALLVGIAACTPRLVPAPVVTAPRFPEFLEPVVPADLASSRAAVNQDRGWRFLQVGDFKNAAREFGLALKAASTFYPAEAGLGYLELAQKDAKASLSHFDRAIERRRDYVPALAGRGQALLALDREADALAAFEATLAADPSLADIRRRVEVLKFRGLEQNLAAARQAARTGRLDEAERAYTEAIARSPESPFLYRELAAVELQRGGIDQALEHFRKAISLDPADAGSLAQVGDILEKRGDLEGARRAYGDSLAVEANGEVEAKLESVRARLALAALPQEYRAIEGAAQITRGDLAALIGVRLAPLLQTGRRRDAVLITDIRNYWAAPWIMTVAQAGVMEPLPTHAFQPRATVRRADLAQAVARLLARVGQPTSAEARAWRAARPRFADLSNSHLAYPAASMAVAAGAMTAPDGSFHPSRPVSGAEAVQAITRLEALAGIQAGKGVAGR
jgi:predicted negative regulator of RcsB-dependent stress response